MGHSYINPLFPYNCRIDGSTEVDFRYNRQQLWMEEMFNRGFVAVTVDYVSGGATIGGCYVRGITGNWGVDNKAKSIFSQDNWYSVLNQVCSRSKNSF